MIWEAVIASVPSTVSWCCEKEPQFCLKILSNKPLSQNPGLLERSLVHVRIWISFAHPKMKPEIGPGGVTGIIRSSSIIKEKQGKWSRTTVLSKCLYFSLNVSLISFSAWISKSILEFRALYCASKCVFFSFYSILPVCSLASYRCFGYCLRVLSVQDCVPRRSSLLLPVTFLTEQQGDWLKVKLSPKHRKSPSTLWICYY